MALDVRTAIKNSVIKIQFIPVRVCIEFPAELGRRVQGKRFRSLDLVALEQALGKKKTGG